MFQRAPLAKASVVVPVPLSAVPVRKDSFVLKLAEMLPSCSFERLPVICVVNEAEPSASLMVNFPWSGVLMPLWRMTVPLWMLAMDFEKPFILCISTVLYLVLSILNSLKFLIEPVIVIFELFPVNTDRSKDQLLVLTAQSTFSTFNVEPVTVTVVNWPIFFMVPSKFSIFATRSILSFMP
ncbi:hypothetical protein [Desulfovibrio piger]|uniref:hypothetical protein n=1 Tax=Desulfovibrio piger TaxID=901 RepID=UPI0026EBEBAD|nr:hypothetical protein [Desulfovibrio piger]